MRRILRKLLTPFFTWLGEKLSAAPRRNDVFKSLTALYQEITAGETKRGMLRAMDTQQEKIIIFSDQHKATRGMDDDFIQNEALYIHALQHYNDNGFLFINLGDAEELWKAKADKVTAAYKDALLLEAAFQAKGRYYRCFGNHDILWKNPLDVTLQLKHIFQMPLPVYEGIVLRLSGCGDACDVFLTHGHQGDIMSDNNAVSTWVIAHIWAPIQRFLRININTPANDTYLRNKHNRMMYEWSSERKNVLLITGHTHKPVFASGRYAEHEAHKIETTLEEPLLRPTYFNTGCCCFNDGDITGIEISEGNIRLVKWHQKNITPQRIVLEEHALSGILTDMTP